MLLRVWYHMRAFSHPDFTPEAVACRQAEALISGLRFYAQWGLKPNPAYTPTFMLNLASQFTGKRYKRREFIRAADDVAVWLQNMKAALSSERVPAN